MRLLLILIGLVSITTVSAQDSDFGVWWSVNATKKLSSRLSGLVEGELRLRENTQTVDCWAGYMELGYDLRPWLRAGGGYTLIEYNRKSVEWVTKHRFNIFVIGTYKVGRVSFAIRERFQQTCLYGSKPHSTIRSRFQASYVDKNIRLRPYITVESYHTISTRNRGLEKIRYTFGSQYIIDSIRTIGIYYRLIDYPSRGSEHILGIIYSLKL